MVKQIDNFLLIEDHIAELEARKESRNAAQRMSYLINDISNYILIHTRTSLAGAPEGPNQVLFYHVDVQSGDLFGSEYKEKIAEFEKEFTRAKEAFDRSIELVVFEQVQAIGTRA